jgi:hypothetical protein
VRERIDPFDRPKRARLEVSAWRPAAIPDAALELEERAATLGHRLQLAAMLGRELNSEMRGEVHGNHRACWQP